MTKMYGIMLDTTSNISHTAFSATYPSLFSKDTEKSITLQYSTALLLTFITDTNPESRMECKRKRMKKETKKISAKPKNEFTE